MKKKLFSLLLAVTLICGSIPVTTYAAGATSGQTSVTYTVSSSYQINIPASINLNDNVNLTVTASTMNTNWGQRVSVLIDGTRTYENGGNFYLYKDKGTASESKISCNLRLNSSLVNGLDCEVGRFDDGSTNNSVGSSLQIEPSAGSAAPGTYTGTLYFRITMS